MLSPVSRPDGRIRPATAQDLGRIAEIVAAAYAMYSDRMDRPPAPVLRDHGDFVRSGRAWVLGDPVVGFICLTARELSLVVENVAVHPSAQRAGLGRQMMEFAEDVAAQARFGRLDLYTNEVMEENLSIYARLGYVEVDRRVVNGYSRVFMQKDIAASTPTSTSPVRSPTSRPDSAPSDGAT